MLLLCNVVLHTFMSLNITFSGIQSSTHNYIYVRLFLPSSSHYFHLENNANENLLFVTYPLCMYKRQGHESHDVMHQGHPLFPTHRELWVAVYMSTLLS